MARKEAGSHEAHNSAISQGICFFFVSAIFFPSSGGPRFKILGFPCLKVATKTMAMTSGATTMARATVMTTVMTTAMAAMAAMVAMARAVWCRHGSASARAAEPFPRRELGAERAKEPVATGVVAVFLGVKIRGGSVVELEDGRMDSSRKSLFV